MSSVLTNADLFYLDAVLSGRVPINSSDGNLVTFDPLSNIDDGLLSLYINKNRERIHKECQRISSLYRKIDAYTEYEEKIKVIQSSENFLSLKSEVDKTYAEAILQHTDAEKDYQRILEAEADVQIYKFKTSKLKRDLTNKETKALWFMLNVDTLDDSDLESLNESEIKQNPVIPQP